MCKTFTEHLLGDAFYHEATRALDKNLSLSSHPGRLPSRYFASFTTGTIDYTPHQENIHRLIEAMNALHVCRISYQSIMDAKIKTMFVKPLKIFSFRDTLYLHARLAKEPGRVYREPDYDPLLAIHRIKKLEITDRPYEYPADYTFEDVFDKTFGVMKDDCFEVEVAFTGWAAHYAAERTWSPDQKINWVDEETLRLIFSASSGVEVISWILSFGENAKAVRPDWLVDEISQKIKKTASLYQ